MLDWLRVIDPPEAPGRQLREPVRQANAPASVDEIVRGPGCECFRLQTQVRDTDRTALDSNPQVVSFRDDLLDFDNTAALCMCMDVVVTIDTSLAHLAGALGRGTGVLLPQSPDFRWMRDREDSPWYPSVQLYRQTVAGDWSGIFDRVAADLHREFL